MVAITWSPQLIDVVKEIKRVDNSKSVSTFNGSKYMESHGITFNEVQALTSLKVSNQSPVSTASWWG
jgi:hypothetical protein